MSALGYRQVGLPPPFKGLPDEQQTQTLGVDSADEPDAD